MLAIRQYLWNGGSKDYFAEERYTCRYTQPNRARMRSSTAAMELWRSCSRTWSPIRRARGTTTVTCRIRFFDIPWIAPGRFGSIEFVINPYSTLPGQNANLVANLGTDSGPPYRTAKG